MHFCSHQDAPLIHYGLRKDPKASGLSSTSFVFCLICIFHYFSPTRVVLYLESEYHFVSVLHSVNSCFDLFVFGVLWFAFSLMETWVCRVVGDFHLENWGTCYWAWRRRGKKRKSLILLSPRDLRILTWMNLVRILLVLYLDRCNASLKVRFCKSERYFTFSNSKILTMIISPLSLLLGVLIYLPYFREKI